MRNRNLLPLCVGAIIVMGACTPEVPDAFYEPACGGDLLSLGVPCTIQNAAEVCGGEPLSCIGNMCAIPCTSPEDCPSQANVGNPQCVQTLSASDENRYCAFLCGNTDTVYCHMGSCKEGNPPIPQVGDTP